MTHNSANTSILEVAFMREAWADQDLPLPYAASPEAAGADLVSNFPQEERSNSKLIAPGARALIPTGLRLALPTGFEAQIRPRSGLALKKGLTLANAPGTIDSDYRGPLGVILINLGSNAVRIHHGMRIAQLVIAPVLRLKPVLVQTLEKTERGTGGFGSTGTEV